MKLETVNSVRKTSEEGVFLVHCNMTDDTGASFDTDYISRPDDMFGVNPDIRAWLEDNKGFPIQPYVPPPEPTIEETREAMAPLTPRQLRLGLVSGGFSTAQVDAAIAAMPDGVEKEKAMIEWEYATTFKRTNPLLTAISAQLGLTEEQVDLMWAAAKDL